MDVFYINVDPKRQLELEKNFKQYAAPNWNLYKVKSADINYVREHNITGPLPDSELAVNTSHKLMLKHVQGYTEPVLLIEDDTRFNSLTCEKIDNFIGNYKNFKGFEWDLIYTDVGPQTIGTMLDLIKLRSDYERFPEEKLLALKHVLYTSISGVIVNPNFIKKYHDMFVADNNSKVIDLYVADQVYTGNIKAFVFFPFITSLSHQAQATGVQNMDTHVPRLVINDFRRLMSIEPPDPKVFEFWSKQIETLDSKSKAYASMFAHLIDYRIWQHNYMSLMVDFTGISELDIQE